MTTEPAHHLGPMLDAALDFVSTWEGSFGSSEEHATTVVDDGRFERAWTEYTDRMKDNFPFFHPRFAGQMLKPPHPVAVAGYLAAMMVNPNNHALDGGPVTSEMEKEVVADLAAMFHLPVPHLGHLTSSGTIANLEALWVARQLAPERRVVFGSNAHYTHARMCQLLGVDCTTVGSDAEGHLDLGEVERCCALGDVGTVVLSAGSTGLGAVDDIEAALDLKERYGVRLHVDAAYGGFFALLAWDEATAPQVPHQSLRAIASCDSVVVDPHKHGLQPYGCGAVLFADPDVGRLYRHDSPYTYFTSDDLHLGEISLECSRAGASAAALWLTLRCLPLEARSGLGPMLAAGRSAAVDYADRLDSSGPLRLNIRPELDIVTYFPWRPGMDGTAISEASRRVLRAGMEAETEPVWLSTLAVDSDSFGSRHRDIAVEEGSSVSVLRSVLMKPEHETWVPRLHERVSELAGEAVGVERHRGPSAPGEVAPSPRSRPGRS